MLGLDFGGTLLMAFGLSADCFAVAVSGGVSVGVRSGIQAGRLALAFGAAQALMTVLGWVAGRGVVDFIGAYDHWVAFVLLAIVGGRMIRESFAGSDSGEGNPDMTRGLALVALSVATSIDALAVGLSLALMEVRIVTAALTIGVVAMAVTAIGYVLGKRAGKLVGRRAEAVGGVILIAIGLRIVLSHLL